jgi:hypothetical protein
MECQIGKGEREMPITYNGYTLKPLSGEEFHKEFNTRADDVITRTPSRPGDGTTLHLPYVNANGHYHLTMVVMPDGDVRRAAVQYNGYGDDGHTADLTMSKKFGCAWSPVEIIDGLTPAPRTLDNAPKGETVTMNEGQYRVIVTPGAHWYMLAQDGPNGAVRVSRMESHPDSTVTLHYVDTWWTFADAVIGANNDSEKIVRKNREVAEIGDLLRPASQD